MTPQLRDVHHRAGASIESQRVTLIYQLFLLENARKTLERELINFTKKVITVDSVLKLHQAYTNHLPASLAHCYHLR